MMGWFNVCFLFVSRERSPFFPFPPQHFMIVFFLLYLLVFFPWYRLASLHDVYC